MPNHLKILHEKSTEAELRVANHIVLWGSPEQTDLVGDYFTPATEFESDYTRSNMLIVDWEHGEDPDPDSPGRDDILGRVDWSTAQKTADGLWVERVLDRRKEYMDYVEELIDAGIFGTSSEAARSGIRRSKSGEIQRWPLKRDALTVQPMEPRMLSNNALTALKSLAQYRPELKALIPEGAEESAAETGREPGEGDATKNSGEGIMPKKDDVPAGGDAQKGQQPNGQQPANVITRDEFKRFQDDLVGRLDEMKSYSEQLNTVLDALENMPGAKKAGIIAPDSETDHANVKSFADFLLAVRYGNAKRLQGVYKSMPVKTGKDGEWQKALSGETGTSGGYMVPTEYESQMMQIAYDVSPILNRVTRVPVGSDSGTYPALDQFVTPTAGSGETALAAGVAAAQRQPGGSLNETEPNFEDIEWRIHNVGGFTKVDNELSADSPQAIGVLLERLFGVAVAAKNVRNILRGSGAGEPLGILNAAAAIGITPDSDNTFAYADALEMKSRFKQVGGAPTWVWHPGIWQDVGVFEVGTGGAVWMANLGADAPAGLLGYGYMDNEHMPQDDNAGCVLLADFAAYLFFERQGLVVAFSEHAAFTENRGTWRFTQRNDGQPWMKDAITLADPQGSYTVSPFVFLND